MKKKELEEYFEKYGQVPKNFFERFAYLLKELKIKESEMEKVRKSIKRLFNARWETFDFVIFFYPKATPRARLGARKVFYVRDASSNNEFFKKFIDSLETKVGVITTPCKIIVDAYLPIPSGMNRIEKLLAELRLLHPVCKPDWDNAGKTYSDMIQKHLLLDDSLLIDGRVRKFYSSKPRIEVRIDFMTEYDCKFNKKKIEGWKTYEELRDRIEDRDSIV